MLLKNVCGMSFNIRVLPRRRRGHLAHRTEPEFLFSDCISGCTIVCCQNCLGKLRMESSTAHVSRHKQGVMTLCGAWREQSVVSQRLPSDSRRAAC